MYVPSLGAYTMSSIVNESMASMNGSKLRNPNSGTSVPSVKRSISAIWRPCSLERMSWFEPFMLAPNVAKLLGCKGRERGVTVRRDELCERGWDVGSRQELAEEREAGGHREAGDIRRRCARLRLLRLAKLRVLKERGDCHDPRLAGRGDVVEHARRVAVATSNVAAGGTFAATCSSTTRPAIDSGLMPGRAAKKRGTQ
jgi:hypothetical protein